MATTMTSLSTKYSVEEREKFARTVAALGLTAPSTIRVFARMFNECGGFPFNVRQAVDGKAVTYLSDNDRKAFVRALDEPMPHAARSLLEKELEWAN